MERSTNERSLSERIVKLFNTKLGITLVLIAPIEILLFLIIMFPFALEIYLSTTPWQPMLGEWWESPFIAYKNYVTLLGKDIRFLMSLARTAMLVGLGVSIEVMLGLGLATLFTRRFAGKKMMFSIMLIPMMIIPVVVGYDFYMLFLRFGPINEVISWITGTVFEFDWLADPRGAFVALLVTDVWHWTPLMFLILYSGLVALPENPVKAAKVLGASAWQIFWKIKFPMLRNLLLLALVIRTMEMMKFFDEIFVMTGGGPGFATETLSMFTYDQAILSMKLGYSAGAAIIILLISVALITFAVWPVLKAARGE
ncbi:MAG: carbohydrate ABC transporter permease [Candidatus Bathyarchaeia archaeon]